MQILAKLGEGSTVILTTEGRLRCRQSAFWLNPKEGEPKAILPGQTLTDSVSGEVLIFSPVMEGGRKVKVPLSVLSYGRDKRIEV